MTWDGMGMGWDGSIHHHGDWGCEERSIHGDGMELRRYVLIALYFGPGLPQQDSAGYAGGDPRQQNARRAAGGQPAGGTYPYPLPHSAGTTVSAALHLKPPARWASPLRALKPL